MGLLSGRKRRGTSAASEHSAAAEPSGGSGKGACLKAETGLEPSKGLTSARRKVQAAFSAGDGHAWPTSQRKRAIGKPRHTQPARRSLLSDASKEAARALEASESVTDRNPVVPKAPPFLH